MAFRYLKVASGYFRQGEILDNIIIPEPVAISPDDDNLVSLSINHHRRMVLLSPECDMKSHHDGGSSPPVPNLKTMNHIVLFDLFEEGEIRNKELNSGIWSRVKDNSHFRYYHLPKATLHAQDDMPDYYIDFKRPFGIGIDFMSTLVSGQIVKRVGLIPYPLLMDLLHRYHSYIGKVWLHDKYMESP
ncbi:hypothetical protein [Dehalogenimonas alkenigignens]|uniref:hypothetical protein n=1 Tax=Dehalogenimonas alkenigignens TaxID=1217799 RepID=UPI000D57CB06|nr:hypothetical protein [Dehalogenimonas alkenigignens]PVV83535.1 hypothetical protein DD509_06810 [Dehalogenimonas alkenigignens]